MLNLIRRQNTYLFNTQILRASAVFLLLNLLEWWLLFLSPFNIPEHVPHTPINIGGLLLTLTIIALFIWHFKRLLLVQPTLSIGKLTAIGALTILLAEIFFQAIRQFQLNADTLRERVYYFVLGTVGMPLFSSVIGFLIAWQLKTKRTK